jgi:hypothetical protein
MTADCTCPTGNEHFHVGPLSLLQQEALNCAQHRSAAGRVLAPLSRIFVRPLDVSGSFSCRNFVTARPATANENRDAHSLIAGDVNADLGIVKELAESWRQTGGGDALPSSPSHRGPASVSRQTR